MLVNEGTSYALPVLLALMVHALALASVTLGWHEDEVQLIKPDTKLYVEAMLVKENPLRAAAKQRENERRKRIATEETRKATAQAIEAKKAAEEQLRKQQIAKPKQDGVRRDVVQEQSALEQEVAREQEAHRQVELAEEDRRRNEWSLSLSVLEEQEYRRAVTDEEKAQAYVAQITRDIIANWSRPPSARNGMQAILKVFLAPTGEVVNVAVVEGSGNEAFDRSAVLAVRKAERFLVPTDPRQFERNFREFSVLFRPEDLRQ